MDLISRQAAIEIVDFECGEWRGLANIIEKRLSDLPPAQPEIEERKEESAQNVPNGELISMEAAIDALYRVDECNGWSIEAIRGLPPAQPEIVCCEDCIHRVETPIADGRYWCKIHDAFMYYCSDAERREG